MVSHAALTRVTRVHVSVHTHTQAHTDTLLSSMTPPLYWTNTQRPVITQLASLASLAPKVNVWSQRQTRDLRLAAASLSKLSLGYCNRSRLTSPPFGWGWSEKRGKELMRGAIKDRKFIKDFFLNVPRAFALSTLKHPGFVWKCFPPSLFADVERKRVHMWFPSNPLRIN